MPTDGVESMSDKQYLANRVFDNISLASSFARELGDSRVEAILSTIAVILYNDQQELIDELFVYFQKELFHKVKQPEEREVA